MNRLFRKLWGLTKLRSKEDELREELQFHLEEEAEQRHQTHGLPMDQARWAARRDLGNLTAVQESTRALWTWTLLEQLLQDLHYATRQLCKSPGFTITAVLMLALGIGTNTAIFSLLNAVLLRSMPVSHPDQLVFLGKAEAEGSTNFFPGGSTQVFSYPFFREFRQRNQVFSDVAAIQSFVLATHGRLAGRTDPEQIQVELVSSTYFATLGVNAFLGQVFSNGDDQTPGAHPVAVIPYSCWRDRFAGDPSITGKTISIRRTTYTIVGVTPRDFRGVTVGRTPDVWIPLAMEGEMASDRNRLNENLHQNLHLIARLKPGVSLQQARTNTDWLFRQILSGYVGPQPTRERLEALQRTTIELIPAARGRSNLRNEFSKPLKILMAVVVLVLMIACANVANLLLVRAAARQQEMALRMSLGAGRARLMRQLLVESAVLGLAGAALGFAFAWSTCRLLLAMISSGRDLILIEVTPDSRVLAFASALTLATVFLFGATPAWLGTRIEASSALRGSRGAYAASRQGLARWLVVGQVAASLVLLACAGLFLVSLMSLGKVDVGFDQQNVVRLQVDPAAANYLPGAALDAMMVRVQERVESLPGVHAASFALTVFDGGGWSQDNVIVRAGTGAEKQIRVSLNIVGPRYFDVMKTPIVLGRSFSGRDNRKVAVINETMARTHFPGGSPIGHAFAVGCETDWQNIEVVGVVKDAKYMDLEEQQLPAAFFPHSQHQEGFIRNLIVRYSGDSGAVVAGVRRAIREIDANLPVSDVKTLTELVEDFTLNRRMVAQLSAAFGILAALLACVGIYGVMSYGVTRRTNEFGIRMALGAESRAVLWLVLRETVGLAVAGGAIGLLLALAAGRMVESLLFGTKASNPVVLGIAVAGMIVAALLAGYLPARRATQIEPSVALRNE